MGRLGFTSLREVLITCAYVLVVVVLICGAFFGVQVLLRPLANLVMRNYEMPVEKIQPGPPHKLPPIQQRKADKPIYIPAYVPPDPSQPIKPEREEVQRAPAPRVFETRRPAAVPFVPPDIHRPQ